MRFAFVPYGACAGRPHVVADGAPQPGTTLTLSHWPGTPTPAGLGADTSAEIALRFLDLPPRERDRLAAGARSVTNNHFDEDGALALLALVAPEAALARRDLVVAAATAGDFLVWRDPSALKVALAISAFTDPARSPLGVSEATRPYPDRVAGRYEAVLARLPAWLEAPDAPEVRALWEEPFAAVEAGMRAFERGRARIDDRPDLDLAVVDRDAGLAPLPRAAVYPRTPRTRVLWLTGGAVEGVSLRYETWVRLASRRPRPRVDLVPLVPVLDRLEVDHTPGGAVAARWYADDVRDITPSLHPIGPDGRRLVSRIPASRFLDALAGRLTISERAGGDFDPYREGRPA
ncbi:MAG TPA: DUF6687 family protein [Thermodesulfobacteriota bacterium]